MQHKKSKKEKRKKQEEKSNGGQVDVEGSATSETPPGPVEPERR